MNAEIIAIGSELLTPHRNDTNSLYLTDQLNRLGVDVLYKTIVGDHRARLTVTIALALRRSDLVFSIGGLGPTEDDLTRECAAAVLRRPLHSDSSIAEKIAARFRARGLRMAEINLRQALVIEGGTALPNPTGTAPGQWIEDRWKILVLLPGPPRELKPMFEQSVLPRLREKVPPSAIRTRVLRLTGLTESAAEEVAAPIYTRYANPVTTILAAPGEIQLHLKSFGKDESEAQARLDELFPQLEAALAEYVFSTDGASLEEVAGRGLLEHKATLAVAESCTGGLLAQRITSVPGSSEYFVGGVVCYSNSWKADWLAVSPADIETHGAVSSAVACALAEGIRRKSAATLGVGITGIAGPSGATAAKPVGLVYIALAAPEGTQVREHRYMGGREIIRWQASQTALDMIRRWLAAARKPS
ncbi:MAG: competence/damage-inducible protein cinA [Acidobacteria bacterium]|nr:competence/damage-inducible protein cinA [Acidobacteriota bacterium]